MGLAAVLIVMTLLKDQKQIVASLVFNIFILSSAYNWLHKTNFDSRPSFAACRN